MILKKMRQMQPLRLCLPHWLVMANLFFTIMVTVQKGRARIARFLEAKFPSSRECLQCERFPKHVMPAKAGIQIMLATVYRAVTNYVPYPEDTHPGNRNDFCRSCSWIEHPTSFVVSRTSLYVHVSSYPRMAFRSSSGVVMGLMLNLSTRTWRTLGEVNAGSDGPSRMS